MPARSLYRWAHNIRTRRLQGPLSLEYTPAHTGGNSPEALANALADKYASGSQYHFLSPPPAPVPTFFMDKFTPFSTSDGYIESSLYAYADHHLAIRTATDSSFRPSTVINRQLYDPHSPPEHPYTRASAAFSVTVQAYLRSSQLHTADKLSSRLGSVTPWCRNGCSSYETYHHIFVECRAFNDLRESASLQLVDDTSKLLGAETTPQMGVILHVAKTLFRDGGEYWPGNCSKYYYGVFPTLDSLVTFRDDVSNVTKGRLLARLAITWHNACIRLVGRIWGSHQRKVSPFRKSVRQTTVSYELPEFLSHFV